MIVSTFLGGLGLGHQVVWLPMVIFSGIAIGVNMSFVVNNFISRPIDPEARLFPRGAFSFGLGVINLGLTTVISTICIYFVFQVVGLISF